MTVNLSHIGGAPILIVAEKKKKKKTTLLDAKSRQRVRGEST